MSTRSDGPWPDRAETVDHPVTLTVLGVDRGDSGLPEELPDAVPEDADAIIIDRPAGALSRRARWSAYARNPALALLGIASAIALASDYLSYGTTDRSFDQQAVTDLSAGRSIPVHFVGQSPLAAVGSVPHLWHVGGWIVTLILFVAAVYGLLSPGMGGVLFAVAALGLAGAYILAYLGSRLERQSERLFSEIKRLADENGYDHPVAVVRRRHRLSLTDHAKEARIRTSDWAVSPTDADDWT
ncbi:hypothetical protein [Natranaeroarchaeum sulfidigenes]|uniref:Uncharacterized protein n=1 Tax=Natranaeroarchaeum sulfidigenes TaxID=2784880 RepID=A0A897MNI0_9EURY|nr:hypothetical protein [Natranaeroarchaeum sulfidigenes]QSG02107.1 hypothetical protein AArcS_0884 [Natranaeroarchaeum sulfidigenes]